MRRTYNGLGEWVKRDACSGFDGGHVLVHVHCREVYTTRAVVNPKVGKIYTDVSVVENRLGERRSTSLAESEIGFLFASGDRKREGIAVMVTNELLVGKDIGAKLLRIFVVAGECSFRRGGACAA